MNDHALARPPRLDRDLVALALALGVSSGLVEGIGHMTLQRLNVQENVWYQIIWMAAVFNGLLLTVIGLGFGLILAWLPDTLRPRLRQVAIFGLAFAAWLPCFALWLKEWVKQYAIMMLLLAATILFTRWANRRWPLVLGAARRSVPWLLAVTGLTIIGIQGTLWWRERSQTARLPAARPSLPDVVVLVIDTFRSDHMSAYGYARPVTPALDRLAREGVLFERAFSASSYTLPSHESILSGLGPEKHGLEWSTAHKPRHSTYPTLPLTLQKLGYRTGAFSGNTYYFTREYGFGRGFLHFEDFFHSVTDVVMRTAYGRIVTKLVLPRLGVEDIPGRKWAEDTNRGVLAWLAKDPARPSFVFINYVDLHDPYLPPDPYRTKFAKSADAGGLLNGNLHVPLNLSAEQVQSEIDAYDGAAAYVDHQFDQLITELRGRQSGRDLLVVVTSDHGEEFREHGGFLHGAHLYREVIQVPLFMLWKGHIPSGLRVRQPVSNTAIPATILDLLQAEADGYPGPSLQKLWSDTSLVWPRPRSMLLHRPWASELEPVHRGTLRSVVSDEWHYIENDGAGRELFGWSKDPAEQDNLAGKPELQDILNQLRGTIGSSRPSR